MLSNPSKPEDLISLTNDTIKYVDNLFKSLTLSKKIRSPNLIEFKFDDNFQKDRDDNKPINEIIRSNPIGGIAAENKGENETKASIRFRINCKDEFPLDAKATMMSEILDNYAYPEVFTRVKNRSLTSKFKLRAVQLILYGNSQKNHILFNDKLRALANVNFKENSPHVPGQQIAENEIDDVLGLYANEQVDEDAANVILLKCNGLWYPSVDLIFDRKKTKSRFETAKQFLNAANYCLEKKLWSPFVDNLFSATELSIQSILLLHHNPVFSIKQTHDQTKGLFSSHANNGNIETKYSKHYNELIQLRIQARYVRTVNIKKFENIRDKAWDMLSLTRELMDYVEKLMKFVDISKKPPFGEYISIGKLKN